MARIAVRELPPLRLSVDARNPSGFHTRWGNDERRPDNVPSGITFGTSMPGGFDNFSCTLPRKPKNSYSDLTRLSNIAVLGASGQIAWEGRLESAPRVAGNNMAVTPGAVGWQAHLDDDTSASMVYVDRDLTHWQEMSNAFRISNLAANFQPSSGSVQPDTSTGLPALKLIVVGPQSAPQQPLCDNWYDAGVGNTIASMYYDFTTQKASGYFTLSLDAADTDTLTGAVAGSGNIYAVSGTGTWTPSSAKRWLRIVWYITSNLAADGIEYSANFRRVTMWGNHGLSKRGTAPDDGVYASDVVAHALRASAPALRFVASPPGFPDSGTIQPTSFVIPQLEFREKTTAGQIISEANRYHLNDWAVWEGSAVGQPTFYYNPRGARGKSWRARVGPSQLEEVGPDTSRLFNGVVVRYSDVDGTAKSVGPTGSGADTISTSVTDTSSTNPVNQLGLRKWAVLDMGLVSTPAAATEVGRRFLVENAAYSTAGSAQLVGYVVDDHGVTYPSWRARAGDTIIFTDAADSTTARRIIKTSYNDADKTNAIDLDSPAQGLDALLERLQVVLVGVL